jgi:hypothetical protein
MTSVTPQIKQKNVYIEAKHKIIENKKEDQKRKEMKDN